MNLKVYVAYLGLNARAAGLQNPFGSYEERDNTVEKLRKEFDLVVWEYNKNPDAYLPFNEQRFGIHKEHNFEPPNPGNSDPTQFELKPVDYLKVALESAQAVGSAKPIAQIFIGLGANVTEFTRNF